MKLIRLAVERPVTTAMFYSAVMLLGIIAWIVLPRELFPTITFPQLLIVTHYGAAAPEEIENIVTKVIEEQAGTVPNLKRIRSISRESLSVVILEFNWGTDMGLAHLAVREKVDLIKDRLPSEAEEPVIQRHNPFAQPTMILSISGNLPLSELTLLSNDVIKKRLQKVEGVASATVSGGQTREITVDLDLDKMYASNISISGVVDALKTSNINYPAGSTQGAFYEYLVRTVGEFKTVSDIGKTVVAVDAPRESLEFAFKPQSRLKGAETFQPRAQRMIPLQNISVTRDTFKETESYSRYNGNSNVSVAVQKQFNANTIKTVRKVRLALKELASSLPKEMNVEVIYDESQFIQSSLTDVISSGVIGGILAFLVILFFLRNVQDASIVTLALPISFFIFFIFLYFTGRTINVIGLAGLALAIGSITDNAICVLDNIDKHYKKLKNRVEAAVQGASEVAVAQTASMLTNVAVFLPLLFAGGLAQQLFQDLFYAAVITNIAALVIALTLAPRIAAYPLKWFRKKEELGEENVRRPMSDVQQPLEHAGEEDMMFGVGGKIASDVQSPTSNVQQVPPNDPPPPAEGDGAEPTIQQSGNPQPATGFWLFSGLTEERAEKMYVIYRSILTWCIDNRKKVIYSMMVLLLLSVAAFFFMKKIFMPAVDQGQFLVRINMPVGTRLEVTNRVITRVEDVLTNMPEIKDTLARVGSSSEESLEALGSHQAECLVTVNREKLREPTETAIVALKDKLKDTNLEGAEIEYLLQDSSMKAATGTSAPILITVKGPDIGTLRKIADDIQKSIKKIPGIEGVKSSLALPSYETRVSIDKDRASGFGLTVSDIARASLIGIRGFIATFFKEQGKEIGVRVRLREENRNNPAAIQRIPIRTQQGVMVPLGDVSTVTGGYGPSEIQRIDQRRALTVSAQVIGRGVGDVIEDVSKELSAYRTFKDYSVTLGGTKQEMQESFGGLAIAFVLAVLLIYMIMAAGFESLLHPFLIMITVPLGVVGVAFTLLLTFTPLSTPVILGMVLLGGIVVNNGIVLIDHINELRRSEKMELIAATVHGCTNRLRPILMTALTNILALFPIALGIGEGTEMSAPMALATLGGLFFSTILTLAILPILYITIEERRQKAVTSDQ